MVGEIAYWCPNGCGKRVRANYDWKYICEVCNSEFKREEVTKPNKYTLRRLKQPK